jgi:hypothetical protein
VPIKVTGIVSYPEASVKVNSHEVNVAKDGTFSAQVQLTSEYSNIQAIASFETQVDDDWIRLFLVDGKIGVVPSTFNGSNMPNSLSIALKAGETKSLDSVLAVRKDVQTPAKCIFRVVTVAQQANQNESPIPGLTVNVEHPDFTIYPYINYHATITIMTKPELVVGNYYLNRSYDYRIGEQIGVSRNGALTKDSVSVIIQP